MPFLCNGMAATSQKYGATAYSAPMLAGLCSPFLTCEGAVEVNPLKSGTVRGLTGDICKRKLSASFVQRIRAATFTLVDGPPNSSSDKNGFWGRGLFRSPN
jgi:hypothetical protein